MNAPRARAEQKYVVVLPTGEIVGTPKGGPLTRDGAWLCERWFQENGEPGAKAVKIQPRPTEEK